MNEVLALFVTEVRRCLARRLVWVLVGLALAAIALASVLTFVNAADLVPTDLWSRKQGDPVLLVTAVYLVIGGFIGGASMVGADWRAGTMTTLLTWEPRRVRLALARFAAVACCAFLIGLALQVVLVFGLLPTMLAHGATDGADASWFLSLVGFLLRSEMLVALAAVVGAALALIGRNTAAALGAFPAYLIVGELIVRRWKSWLIPWLLSKNGNIFLRGFNPDESYTVRIFEYQRGRTLAAATATLVLYTVVVVAAAVATFRSRDVTGT